MMPGVIFIVAPALAGDGILNGLRGEHRWANECFFQRST